MADLRILLLIDREVEKHTKMKKSIQGIRNFFKPKQTRDEVPADRDPTNDNFTSKTTSIRIVDKLDIIKIANSFIQTNENRSRVFGRFTENDL